MTQHYRLLTKEEIARLEAQHCIASDWSGVEVADDFHTDYIHHTRFSGKVRSIVFCVFEQTSRSSTNSDHCLF